MQLWTWGCRYPFNIVKKSDFGCILCFFLAVWPDLSSSRFCFFIFKTGITIRPCWLLGLFRRLMLIEYFYQFCPVVNIVCYFCYYCYYCIYWLTQLSHLPHFHFLKSKTCLCNTPSRIPISIWHMDEWKKTYGREDWSQGMKCPH